MKKVSRFRKFRALLWMATDMKNDTPVNPSLYEKIRMTFEICHIKVNSGGELTFVVGYFLGLTIALIYSLPNAQMICSTIASIVCAYFVRYLRYRFHVVNTRKDVVKRRNIIIGDKVTSLKNFIGATERKPNVTLKHVRIANEHALQSVGESAFRHCQKLETVRVAEGIETIEANAFAECHYLMKVVLPQSLRHIQEAAFQNCTTLLCVIMPKDIKTIEANAFAGCTEFISFGIPGTTRHGRLSFAQKDFVFPNDISIGDSAFLWCDSFIQITFGGNIASICPNSFRCSKKKKLIFQSYNPKDKEEFLNRTFPPRACLPDDSTAEFQATAETWQISSGKWVKRYA